MIIIILNIFQFMIIIKKLKEIELYTEKILVQIKKMDDFNFVNIDFIKIDVQGYEYEVLKGAKKTLINSKPILCIEEDNFTHSKSINFLKSLNYEIVDKINKEYIFKKK